MNIAVKFLCKSVLIMLVLASGFAAHAGQPFGEEPEETLHILAFGDFGTSDAAQYKVARTMQQYCGREKCDFGLLLGDNFYPSGVKSTDDPQFKTAFEAPYGPLKIPFYVSLGNHDYGNGGERGNINAQLNYAKRNPQWIMPARYYKFKQHSTEFFVLDTNTLASETAQLEWFKKEYLASAAKFRVVFAHHPIYSNGEHGGTNYLIQKLLPTLCEGEKNTVYISGHDHHLESLKSECGLNLIISGGAAYHRKVLGTARSQFQAASTGFVDVQIGDSKAEVTFISGDGKELYKQTLLTAP